MCVCMYMCVYVYVCEYVYTCIHTNRRQVSVSARLPVHVRTCVFLVKCVQVYMYMCVYICVHMCTCVYRLIYEIDRSRRSLSIAMHCCILQCVAAHCNALQCVAVFFFCSVLH